MISAEDDQLRDDDGRGEGHLHLVRLEIAGRRGMNGIQCCCSQNSWTVLQIWNDLITTAVSSEAWAKLRDWASVAGRGRLLLSGSVAHASLKTALFACLRVHSGTI